MTKKEFMAIETKGATKANLLDALRDLPKTVKDKSILDRVNYTLEKADKSVKNVTVGVLSDLIADIKASLSPAPAPVEASRKTPKTTPKKAEPDDDVDDDTDDEEEEEKPTPKKSGKKSLKMKTAKPKTKASKELPIAKMFPATLTFESEEGKQELVCAHDKYHDIDEVRSALNEGKTLFIAAYWTKRHIQQYNYKEQFMVPNAPKSFPDDLDMLNVVITCDTVDRVFAMSTYTEALYKFDGETFKPIEDDDDGEKFTVRVSNGMEFEVYEIANEG